MPFHQAYAGIEQPAIGCLIREVWQTLKLTQEKFAAQLRVTFPTINRWKIGHACPSSLALKQIDSLLQPLNNSPDVNLRELGKDLQAKYFSQRKEEE
jgi:putative transcriptional regulator